MTNLRTSLLLLPFVFSLGCSDQTTALVATKDIPRGKPFSLDNVGFVPLPNDQLPRSALDSFRSLDGFVATRYLPRGTVLTKTAPGVWGQLDGPTRHVPDGYGVAVFHVLAISLPPTIRIGDKVDLWAMSGPRRSATKGPHMVLTDVEIFAINTSENSLEFADDRVGTLFVSVLIPIRDAESYKDYYGNEKLVLVVRFPCSNP